MKLKMKGGLCFFSLFISTVSFTQVNWSYSAKKTADKKYEVHIVATVSDPWHIYSQFTPDGGPFATEISFNKNPLLVISGKPNEVGKMQEKYEDVFGINVKYYEEKVDFVQAVI